MNSTFQSTFNGKKEDLKKFFGYLKEYIPRYLVGLFVLFFTDFFTLITPKLTAFAIDAMKALVDGTPVKADLYFEIINDHISAWADSIRASHSYTIILWAGILIIGVNVIAGVFRFFWRQYIMRTSFRVDYDLRNDYYGKLLSLPMSFYSKFTTGEIMSRATSDLGAIRQMAGPGIMAMFDPVFMGLISIFNMWVINKRLALTALLPLPLIAILVFTFEKIIYKYFKEVQQKFSEITNFSQNSFQGIKIIKSYVKESAISDRFAEGSDQYRKSNLKLIRTEGLFHPMIVFFSSLSLIIILWYGGRLVINGQISIGNFYAFQGYLLSLVWPMIAIGWVITIWVRGTASMSRVNEILKEEDTLLSGERSIYKINSVEFKNVWFKYPASKDWVLRNINFTISGSERIAFVGKIGCGKTTIFEVLLRFYDVQKGEILINGANIKEYNTDHLRRAMGYVPQDSFLFSESLKDNIILSKKDIAAELEKTIMNSGLDDTINDFRDGIGTVVGERGITLSGGQRQRMTIARALYGSPEIILFDDSFSAIDSHIEKKIQNNIEEDYAGIKQIFITHRFSAIQHVDRIYVLKSGEIVESGRYSDLIEKKGEFYKIKLTQQLEEEK